MRHERPDGGTDVLVMVLDKKELPEARWPAFDIAGTGTASAATMRSAYAAKARETYG